VKSILLLALSTAAVMTTQEGSMKWPAPKAPVVSGADGYVDIPNAAIAPDKARSYRAVFDATRAAGKPTEILPALNMVGSELNALGVAGVPLANAKFVVVFHGAAIDAILADSNYKAKYGTGNPNLKVLEELNKAGVGLFVCGQQLAFDHIDPRTLSGDVTVAADALIALMTYQNDGYAILNF
jgi:intracellular sulfur oxidation DsrE/DsrF family protein